MIDDQHDPPIPPFFWLLSILLGVASAIVVLNGVRRLLSGSRPAELASPVEPAAPVQSAAPVERSTRRSSPSPTPIPITSPVTTIGATPADSPLVPVPAFNPNTVSVLILCGMFVALLAWRSLETGATSTALVWALIAGLQWSVALELSGLLLALFKPR